MSSLLASMSPWVSMHVWPTAALCLSFNRSFCWGSDLEALISLGSLCGLILGRMCSLMLSHVLLLLLLLLLLLRLFGTVVTETSSVESLVALSVPGIFELLAVRTKACIEFSPGRCRRMLPHFLPLWLGPAGCNQSLSAISSTLTVEVSKKAALACSMMS